MAAPRAREADAPMTTEARTAAVPLVKNHGISGRMAPTEKEENDTTAACQDEPGSSGSTPEPELGVRIEGNVGIGHQDAGPLCLRLRPGHPELDTCQQARGSARRAGSSESSPLSTSISCRTRSSWARTETNSPAAMENAPASSPAIPAIRTALALLLAPATPSLSEMRLPHEAIMCTIEFYGSKSSRSSERCSPTRPPTNATRRRGGHPITRAVMEPGAVQEGFDHGLGHHWSHHGHVGL